PQRQRIPRPPWRPAADCGQEAAANAGKATGQAGGGNRREPKQTGGTLCLKVRSPSRGRDRKVHRRSLYYLQRAVSLLSYASSKEFVMARPNIVVGLTSALLLGFITPCLAQETIGAPLVARALTDTAAGSIFALNGGFTQPATLTTWAFYNDNPNQTGLVLTPLILELVGNEYIIRGV